jgi:hypothetical protein
MAVITGREEWERRWRERTQPLPAEREPLAYARTFSVEEMERVRHGVLPNSMDDKWLILHTDGWLNLHRSWTGRCIYALRLAESPDGQATVAEAWVNTRPEHYSHEGPDRSPDLLSWLIEALLLGKRGVPFPD